MFPVISIWLTISAVEKLVTKKILINNKQTNNLSESQKEYHEILKENEITICTGPAGVGKSYIAMKAAVDLLSDKNNAYEKIMIVRPAVEAEEKLGALPGNLEEKLDSYIFPSYYLLNKIIGKEARENLKDVELEFEEYRKKTLLNEQKLRRQLQDEINKHK